MNDLTKSYYEIANEEYNKPAKVDLAKSGQKLTDQQDRYLDTVMKQIESEGLTYGSEEWLARLVELADNGETNKAADGSDVKEQELSDDDEMMEKEQAAQSKMMKTR